MLGACLLISADTVILKFKNQSGIEHHSTERNLALPAAAARRAAGMLAPSRGDCNCLYSRKPVFLDMPG
jgi:hypothetical protein